MAANAIHRYMRGLLFMSVMGAGRRGGSRRYGIVPARMPGMATRQAFQSQPGAAKRPEALHCLQGVLRA